MWNYEILSADREFEIVWYLWPIDLSLLMQGKVCQETSSFLKAWQEVNQMTRTYEDVLT